MKIIPVLSAILLAASFSSASAFAGTISEVPVSTAELAQAIGLNAHAFNFTFDKPVYCEITLELNDPKDAPTKMSSFRTQHPLKNVRASYCITHPDTVAGSLGLPNTQQASSQVTQYRTSAGNVSTDQKNLPTLGFSISGYIDPVQSYISSHFTAYLKKSKLNGATTSYQTEGVPENPNVELNKDIIIYGKACILGLPKDTKKPVTVKGFRTFKRYVMIFVRFSEKPFSKPQKPQKKEKASYSSH